VSGKTHDLNQGMEAHGFSHAENVTGKFGELKDFAKFSAHTK
jgi:hypothetical protein